jgi:hypothetical protein
MPNNTRTPSFNRGEKSRPNSNWESMTAGGQNAYQSQNWRAPSDNNDYHQDMLRASFSEKP